MLFRSIAATDWNQNTVDNPIALRTGGIAIASQAANDIIYASSSTQLARLAAGTAGYVLTTNGAGSAPTWSAVSSSGDQAGKFLLAEIQRWARVIKDAGVKAE